MAAKEVVQVIDLQILRDTAGTKKMFSDTDIIDTTTGNFTATFPKPAECRDEEIDVPDAAVAQVIPFNNIAEATLFYIQTNRQITLNYTDAVEGAQSITLAGSAARLGRFLVMGRITAATIDNSSGATATVLAVIAG